MNVRFLTGVATLVGIASFATIVIVFSYPDSAFACTLDRFQTLFTGVLASLIALAAAGFFYRAAKLPVEAERDRVAERKKAMKTAGAAQLLSAIQGIFLTVTTEASRPPKDRLGKLLVPDALPSLETISTQDNEVIHGLAVFLASASAYDAHIALNTWEYDPIKTHTDEKIAHDDLAAKLKKLINVLAKIAGGGEP